jgi:hypothetical protein
MRQSIGGYIFEGPYPNLERIESIDGLWAIITTDSREYYLVDVDYSSNVKNALGENPRESCWEEFTRGQLLYAYFHEKQLSEIEYKSILKDIRKKYLKIPCGN